MHTKIIQAFEQITSLSETEKESFCQIVSQKQLKKGEFWLQEDKMNLHIAFLESGYLRKYYVKEGNEITDFFYFENDFCADLPSIIGNLKPNSNIVAMKTSNLTTFSYANFNLLCKNSATFEHIYRIMLEQTFLRFYKRTVSFIMQSPKERYEELLKNNRIILEKATQYHIASYLGISYQHLSRLRSNK